MNFYFGMGKNKSWSSYSEIWYKQNYYSFGYSIGGQLPIGINSFMISPYLLGGLELEYADNGGMFGSIRLGSRFGYQFKNDKILFIACEYVPKLLLFGGFDYNDNANKSFLNLSLGIIF